jgi:hypothetical protein
MEDDDHRESIKADVDTLLTTALGQPVTERVRGLVSEEVSSALSDTFRPQILEMAQAGVRAELTRGDHIRPHVEATITEKGLVPLDEVAATVEKAIQDSLPQQEPGTIMAVDRETVRETVREEIGSLFGDIQIREIKKPGKGHKRRTIKKSVTMPIEVYEEIDEYCKDNDALISNVITAALQMFLKSRDLLEEEATTSDSGDGTTI